MTFTVPVFEPEVIQAAARRWRGETDKVATTSLGHLMHGHARLTSRYRKAAELELMVMALDTLPDHASISVESMDCDSTWRSFEVRARCGRIGLEYIDREMSRALRVLSGGHGNLILRGPTGAKVSLEPAWNAL